MYFLILQFFRFRIGFFYFDGAKVLQRKLMILRSLKKSKRAEQTLEDWRFTYVRLYRVCDSAIEFDFCTLQQLAWSIWIKTRASFNPHLTSVHLLVTLQRLAMLTLSVPYLFRWFLLPSEMQSLFNQNNSKMHKQQTKLRIRIVLLFWLSFFLNIFWKHGKIWS